MTDMIEQANASAKLVGFTSIDHLEASVKSRRRY